MIFGKSYKEKADKRQRKLEELKNKIWFAWYPIKEICGKFVWLQKVKVEYGIYGYSNELWRPHEKPLYHIIKKIEKHTKE